MNPSSPIAVIGLACRAPGAPDVEAFWRLVLDGRHAVERLDRSALLAAGEFAERIDRPGFVPAYGRIEDVDAFDAAFFGISPGEAALMDPQIRIGLECAHAAFDAAGRAPGAALGRVGVYVSASASTYLLDAFTRHPGFAAQHGGLRLLMASDKDHLAGQIAYRLDLRGPSMAIGAACASSLVAIDVACRALAAGDVELALAGGVSVHFPRPWGYMHEPGAIYSREGRCRAFDAAADGVTPGEGAAMVLLKPLARALEDGDVVHAVVLGAAVTGDGAGKVGYTAPSEDGQVRAISLAWERAGVHATAAGLIEGHGTGTPLGDAVEIASLHRALPGARCALGSVKSNVGHLDAAAGALSFIKAVKAVEHGVVPPSLHVERPNPALIGAASAFDVPRSRASWPGRARRVAGVSSFGIGGVNAHVVLAEAPLQAAGLDAPSVLTLAARDGAALARLAGSIGEAIAESMPPLRDLAWTLASRSAPHPVRCAARVANAAEARAWLAAVAGGAPPVFIPSPGESTDASVAAWLDAGEVDGLETQVAQGASRRVALPPYPFDRRQHRLESIPALASIADPLPAPMTLPALIRAALDRHLAQDVPPTIDQRHGLGAALDALCARLALDALVALGAFDASGRLRGRAELLAQGNVDSSMEALLDHLLATATAESFHPETPPPALSTLVQRVVAADPGFGAFAELLCDRARNLPLALSDAKAGTAALYGEPGRQAIAGALRQTPDHSEAPAANHALAEALALRARSARRAGQSFQVLEVGAGSGSLTSALRAALAGEGARLVVSDISRLFLTQLEERWPADETLRYRLLDLTRDPISQGFAEESFDAIVALDALHAVSDIDSGLDAVRRLLRPGGSFVALETMRPSRWTSLLWGLSPAWWSARADHRGPLRTLAGWQRFLEGHASAFETAVAAPAAARAGGELGVLLLTRGDGSKEASGSPADWLYTPAWAVIGRVRPGTHAAPTVMLLPDTPMGEALARACARRTSGASTFRCIAAPEPAQVDAVTFRVRPDSADDLARAFDTWNLRARGEVRLVHAFALEAGTARRAHGLDSVIALARALAQCGVDADVRIGVLTDGVCDVTGRERLDPLATLVDAPVRLLEREQPNLRAFRLDVDPGEGPDVVVQAVDGALALLDQMPADPLLALRGDRLWREGFERRRNVPATMPSALLPAGGIAVVLGGLGSMGLALAQALAEASGTHLALVSRRPPATGAIDREQLDALALSGTLAEPVRVALARILEAGASVSLHAADVADADAMAGLLAELERTGRAVRAVVHAAGEPDRGGVMLRRSDAATATALRAKVDGMLALRRALGQRRLDLLVLCASIGSLLPKLKFGEVAYVAGNLHLVATAQALAREAAGRTLAISWTDWRGTGMWADAQERLGQQYRLGDADAQAMPDLLDAISPEQGRQAFLRALSLDAPHVVVCAQPLDLLFARHAAFSVVDHAAFLESRGVTRRAAAAPPAAGPQPDVTGSLESRLARMWAELLGVPQVGIDDDFFDLGGDSLLGIRVLSRLREEFGVDDSLAGLMSATTVRRLSERVRALCPDTAVDSGATSAADFEELRL